MFKVENVCRIREQRQNPLGSEGWFDECWQRDSKRCNCYGWAKDVDHDLRKIGGCTQQDVRGITRGKSDDASF
jgi:hypothetical protein